MKSTLFLFLASILNLASAQAAQTELTCDIRDRSMYFREDYYFQPHRLGRALHPGFR